MHNTQHKKSVSEYVVDIFNLFQGVREEEIDRGIFEAVYPQIVAEMILFFQDMLAHPHFEDLTSRLQSSAPEAREAILWEQASVLPNGNKLLHYRVGYATRLLFVRAINNTKLHERERTATAA